MLSILFIAAAVTSAVAACTELEKLPLSFKATQKILSNLVKAPEEPKYRKLRLENKRVKELLDFDPVLNILSAVGFARKQCPREQKNDTETKTTTQTEEVLVLEGEVPISQIKDLLNIFEGLSPQQQHSNNEQEAGENKCDSSSPSSREENKRRKVDDDTETIDDTKKQRK